MSNNWYFLGYTLEEGFEIEFFPTEAKARSAELEYRNRFGDPETLVGEKPND